MILESEGGTMATGRSVRRQQRVTGAALLWLVLCAVPAGAQQGSRVQEVCASCHEDIRPERERALAHADSVTCLSCHHIGFTNDPVKTRSSRLQACAACHAELGPSHADVPGDAPTCDACHSVHDDPPLSEAPLPTGRCQACHETPHGLHAGLGEKAPPCSACHTLSSDGFLPSAELQRQRVCVSCHEGLPAAHQGVEEGAPLCADCHSFTDDPPLPEATLGIAERCGACHEDAMAGYRAGGHAQGLDAKDPNGDLPNCLTCHPAHDRATEGRAVRLAATIRCVECHSQDLLARKYDLSPDVGASYTEDFHGATVRFLWDHPAGEGQPDVLTCSDCHGAHAVGWRDGAVVADVCVRCHEDGDAKLAGAWLGHTPPGPRNQPMVWLLRLFYYVLIPFALTGLALNIAFHLIDQRRGGARVLETEGMKRILARLSGAEPPRTPTVKRFGVVERLEHLGSMTTFILLVVTGLPQTRPDLAAAQWVIGVLGGIGTTRLVHRIVGFTFVVLLLLHVTRAVVGALRKRQLPPMVPSPKDFRDTLGTLKHYFRRTPRPKVGKFDFSEKFEYWGLLLGGTVMSVTGVALVFPELVTQVVPGVLVAAFRIMHGLEATFAVLVIALWHSYGVVLRPEIFPLDTSIFTGRISVERLKEEHALEYERLFPDGAEGEERPAAHGPPPREEPAELLLGG